MTYHCTCPDCTGARREVETCPRCGEELTADDLGPGELCNDCLARDAEDADAAQDDDWHAFCEAWLQGWVAHLEGTTAPASA